MTEHESPLSPAARAGLVANAAATILLFYATATLWMGGLGALALVLLAATAFAARFGMAALVARMLRIPVRVLGIFGRKLWLPSGPTYHIVLTPLDAPGLFEIARDLSRRAAVASPESISISRQDEFAADRGAVELCGAAVIRSALGVSTSA